jgi:hypothetical protein
VLHLLAATLCCIWPFCNGVVGHLCAVALHANSAESPPAFFMHAAAGTASCSIKKTTLEVDSCTATAEAHHAASSEPVCSMTHAGLAPWGGAWPHNKHLIFGISLITDSKAQKCDPYAAASLSCVCFVCIAAYRMELHTIAWASPQAACCV